MYMPWDDSAWSDQGETQMAAGWSVSTASDRDSDDSAEVAAPLSLSHTHTHTHTMYSQTHARAQSFSVSLRQTDAWSSDGAALWEEPFSLSAAESGTGSTWSARAGGQERTAEELEVPAPVCARPRVACQSFAR